MAADVSMSDGDEDDVIAAINIVPFVDIVLVVLIIFMVTSTAIIKAAFKVDLPSAANAGESVESTINIVYGSDPEGGRRLFVNGEESDKDRLAALVKSEAELNEKVQAVIAADQAVPYGEVVSIIDLIKGNGVTSFALNIERTEPTPPDDPPDSKL